MALSQHVSRRTTRLLAAALALAALAGCGGGGGGGGTPDTTVYLDPNHYSAQGSASLATPNETTAVTHRTLTLGGNTVAYTATAGHLSAQTAGGTPEASIFYVAYTADGAAPGTRPVTFFFNGGPGSATVWLHLGSFAPRRLATGVPATTQAVPFPYVDNADSLIDTSDLVFVDAVGTGLSEAIAPNTNQTFWGVDADAAVLRDFITRWRGVNGRAESPLFLYGESYGTVRVPVLTRLLETAGVRVAGAIELSSVLDYNSNCSINLPTLPSVGCAGALPSYAATGSWYGLATAATPDLDAYMATVTAYADATYAPDAATWLADATLPPDDHIAVLVGFTGLPVATWRGQFDMDYDTFRHHLIANTTLGVYDARISAPVGSALDADDEPSNTFVAPGFRAGIATVLHDELGFTTPSTYVISSDAINTWVFAHAGRSLPDVVPDLAAAMSLDPSLKILFAGGRHDLITPFHQTELDLARLPAGAPVATRFHAGGHMTYLDDASRPLMKADLVAFYAAALEGR
ncbi:MAG: peptidase S10 [Betaproteobacteria bacterium]